MKLMLSILLILCTSALAFADYEPAVVHVIYVDGSAGVDLITATEFAIANLPLDQCTMTMHWSTDLVIGEDLSEGVALAFVPPLTGPHYYFGYLEFTALEPVAADHTFEVVGASYNGNLVIVDGDYNTIDVGGGNHTFNCTEYCSYFCGEGYPGFIGLWADPDALYCHQDIEVFTTPARESSFGLVKSLY